MKKRNKILAALLGAVAAASAMTLSASAEFIRLGYRGDVNRDEAVNVLDIVKLQKILFGMDHLQDDVTVKLTDMDDDDAITAFDLAIIKKTILNKSWYDIYIEVETTTEPTTDWTEPSTEPPTEPTTEYIEPVEPVTWNEAVIAECDAGLPSHGNGNLVVFYVDFPDCRYTTDFSEEQLRQIAFGASDESDPCYPFESMSAFYARSSKGALDLNGTVIRYTTKENQAVYDNDKVKIVEECYEAFKDTVDFSQYDGDGDGKIDATLITVPTAAGDDAWWPCAGGFGDPYYEVDGKTLGHLITGNAEVVSLADYKNFNSSYLHEMGHCMGLPDYYLYSSDDYEGFHGDAGSELMDADAYSDFGCFSKLMLGWYKQNQVSVYDASLGSQTFSLYNAQTDNGNCVIIPNGSLDGQYFSEYFILEYVTPDGNNCGLPRDRWWETIGSGIRIYHAKADLQRDYWWTFLKYQNGSEYCGGNDDGIRLVRLVGDGEGVFTTGDVISSGTSGFGWYDANENESVNPGVTITVGELVDGQYQVTIANS